MEITKQTVIGKLDGWADILGQFSHDLRSPKLRLRDGRSSLECSKAEDEELFEIASLALTSCSQLRMIIERLKQTDLL